MVIDLAHSFPYTFAKVKISVEFKEKSKQNKNSHLRNGVDLLLKFSDRSAEALFSQVLWDDHCIFLLFRHQYNVLHSTLLRLLHNSYHPFTMFCPPLDYKTRQGLVPCSFLNTAQPAQLLLCGTQSLCPQMGE